MTKVWQIIYDIRIRTEKPCRVSLAKGKCFLRMAVAIDFYFIKIKTFQYNELERLSPKNRVRIVLKELALYEKALKKIAANNFDDTYEYDYKYTYKYN